MAPRALVCIEDTAVAHVLAARLVRDGIEGVVVGDPAALTDEARKGCAAVAVQDKYVTGELASTLLRRVRVVRGQLVDAVVLLTHELSPAERHVLERQWRVTRFLPAGTSPNDVADAVRTLVGVPDPGAADIVDPDVSRSGFDVAVQTSADSAISVLLDDDDDDGGQKTVEMSKAQLQKLKQMPGAEPTAKVLALSPAGGRPGGTSDDADLSQLPAPGGDDDLVLDPAAAIREGALSGRVPPTSPGAGDQTTGGGVAPRPPAPPAPGPMGAPGGAPGAEAGTAEPEDPVDVSWTTPTAPAAPTPAARPPNPETPDGAAERDAMQIQELQRTQAELKKALVTERKARETAQKRVEELEQRLSKMGEEPAHAGQGVPAEGVFEDVRYPALLARCRAEAFTGAIVMQTGGATRSVFLKDGLPVAFSSSEPGQRIGKLLVAQGRITDEQYMKAATRMVERSIKLTDALVELGLIDAESLAVEQRNITRDQIIQGFELVQGRFTTQAGATPDANTTTFDFGPGEIYVQGYRRYAPASEMLATFETLRDKYLVTQPRLASYRPKLGLSSDDERFLRLLGEAYTVEEATERAGLGFEAVARLLAAMQALDLVDEWSPGVEQFRSRLRAERQRHAEEIARLVQESRAREDRLLDAFQKALAGNGSAAVLASARDERGDAPKPEPRRDEPRRDEPRRDEPRRDEPRRDEIRKATVDSGLPALSSTPSSSSPSSSSTSSSSSLPPLSASSSLSAVLGAAGRGEGRSARGDNASRPSTPPRPSSTSAATSPPTAAAAPTSGASAPPSSSTIELDDTASSVMVAPAAATSVATPSPTEPTETPADRKFREAMTLAQANQLDEAELTLREAVRLDPTRPEYLIALARVLLDNPRYERAGTLPVVRSLLDRAVHIAPSHKEATEMHAAVVAEMGG
jgi:hypothetical protein